MKSRLCEMFGIEAPIFAFSHCRDVVVEVSKAGGMGVLGMARMSRAGGHVRSLPVVREALADIARELKDFASTRRVRNPGDLVEAFIDRDILITQFAFLSAIEAYLLHGGPSRGGYLVERGDGAEDKADPSWNPDLEVEETRFRFDAEGVPACTHRWVPARPIPKADEWFENVWRDYRTGEVWR